MRRSVLALVFLALCASSAEALGVYGLWWGSDDLGDGVGLGVRHRVSLLPLSADVRAGWIRFEDATAVPLEAAGTLGMGLFYAGAGAGYVLVDRGIRDDVELFGLGGVSLSLLGLGAFAEIRYVWFRPQAGEPLRELTGDGFGIQAGALLGW